MLDHLLLHCVVARELASLALTLFGVHLVMPWTVIEVFTLSENLVIMKKARFVGHSLHYVDNLLEEKFSYHTDWKLA